MIRNKKAMRYIYRLYHLEEDIYIFDGDYKFKDDIQVQDFVYDVYSKCTLVKIEKYERKSGAFCGYCEIRV